MSILDDVKILNNITEDILTTLESDACSSQALDVKADRKRVQIALLQMLTNKYYFTEKPKEKQVIPNIIQQNIKNPFNYECPGCSEQIIWSDEDFADQGEPVCNECDLDMDLIPQQA